MRNLSSPLILAVLLFLSFSSPVLAANPLDVVINEIAWMGTEVEGIESKNWWRYEWLEFYNNTGQPTYLDGWKIELYRTSLDWVLELKGVIPSQGYFLIVASDKISPNYDLNYSNLGGKFINSGQKVLLKDSLGNIIDNLDCFSYGKWFAGDNSTKQTMERKNPLSKSDFDNWGTSLNPGGTPKAENSVAIEVLQPPEEEIIEPEPQPKPQPEPQPELEKPKPITYPSGIRINEILPSPTGPDEQEEWIEIFNQNNFEVDLSGWQIIDTEGTTKTYTFLKGTIIGAEGFLVLSRPTTKITLNNSGDGLNFIRPDGKIIDSVTYEKAPRGQSYNRIDSEWTWSTILTPGSANIIPAPIEEAEPSQEEIKALAPEKETKEALPKKELAAIGEQIPKKTPFLPFLIALAIAIFSGIIILILKKKIKEGRAI